MFYTVYNMQKNMVYISNLKDPALYLFLYILNLYQGLNRESSAPEVDDIQMCHRASLSYYYFIF